MESPRGWTLPHWWWWVYISVGSGPKVRIRGHLVLTRSGSGPQTLFSLSSFFQNTNSAPGGPKSWAQLNGKPAGHEGGKCVCGVAVGGWEGGVPFLGCSSSVQAVFGLQLCGLSSQSELLPLPRRWKC